MLDHGLDNLNHHCLSMVVVSVLSGFVFKTPVMRFVFILSLQMNVVALHTYKLIKGSLEFPYYVDASHLIISILFFSFGKFGVEACFSWKIIGYIGLKEIVIFIALISTNLSSFELFYKATRVDSTVKHEFISYIFLHNYLEIYQSFQAYSSIHLSTKHRLALYFSLSI